MTPAPETTGYRSRHRDGRTLGPKGSQDRSLGAPNDSGLSWAGREGPTKGDDTGHPESTVTTPLGSYPRAVWRGLT